MAKAAIRIEAFLQDLHPVRKEGQSDLTAVRFAGNESSDITLDVSFADRLADVWITASGHPLAIELHLEFLVTKGEDAEVISAKTVDAIDPGGGYYACGRPRGGASGVLRRRQYNQRAQDDGGRRQAE